MRVIQLPPHQKKGITSSYHTKCFFLASCYHSHILLFSLYFFTLDTCLGEYNRWIDISKVVKVLESVNKVWGVKGIIKMSLLTPAISSSSEVMVVILARKRDRDTLGVLQFHIYNEECLLSKFHHFPHFTWQ